MKIEHRDLVKSTNFRTFIEECLTIVRHVGNSVISGNKKNDRRRENAVFMFHDMETFINLRDSLLTLNTLIVFPRFIEKRILRGENVNTVRQSLSTSLGLLPPVGR